MPSGGTGTGPSSASASHRSAPLQELLLPAAGLAPRHSPQLTPPRHPWMPRAARYAAAHTRVLAAAAAVRSWVALAGPLVRAKRLGRRSPLLRDPGLRRSPRQHDLVRRWDSRPDQLAAGWSWTRRLLRSRP
uniref:Uncharacterized protein n=1 Tax=Zea mays TaxID=4577 RepID=B7ZZG2_MAIZE|nr:unknown [Zea mays]